MLLRKPADVAELADAQASGACGLTLVKVQLLSSALSSREKIISSNTLQIPAMNKISSYESA